MIFCGIRIGFAIEAPSFREGFSRHCWALSFVEAVLETLWEPEGGTVISHSY